jgi:hypothetical protein
VPELPLAIGGDEHQKAAREWRRVRSIPVSAELGKPNRHTLGQGVHSNQRDWHWAISAESYLVSTTPLLIGHDMKRDLSTRVTNFFKFVGHVASSPK